MLSMRRAGPALFALLIAALAVPAVADVVTFIEAHPEIGTPVGDDPLTRRVLVHRFPYQVVYRLTASEILIVAVAHLKRRPGYWKDRT